MYLQRYHAITLSQGTTWRILKRAGVSRLSSNMRYRRRQERYQRYEKPLPGHQLQIDVTFLAPVAGRPRRYYQYTAIDDCTRVRVLKIYERNTQQTAMPFVDEVLARLPFTVECIQTDNGSEFGSQFHWHLLDKGVRHRYIRPRRPYLNGRRSGPTESTTKSSTASWTGSSSRPPKNSTHGSGSGNGSTTTIGPTEALTVKLRMNGCENACSRVSRMRPEPR
jgi:hypothetical protein